MYSIHVSLFNISYTLGSFFFNYSIYLFSPTAAYRPIYTIRQTCTQYTMYSRDVLWNVTNFRDLLSDISGIAYWLFGYAFAYGEGNDFIGYSNFAIKDLPDNGYANFFFQYSFAATTATIVSGSVAERCEFSAYLIYSFFITGLL